MTELNAGHEAAERDEHDKHDWEDIKDEKPHASTITPPMMYVPPQSPKPSVRKRTIHIVTPSRKPLLTTAKKQQLPPKPKREPRQLIDKEEWIDAAIQFTALSWNYSFNVLGGAIQLLRKPLSLMLFLWLLALIMIRVSSAFSKAFAPLCYIPGISGTAFCLPMNAIVSGSRPPQPQWADYPRMVEVQSTNFEQLLQDSAGGSGLSLDIKQAEMATKDLITLVRVSRLHSRDELANSLGDFVEVARSTGRGLQKLDAKIEGAVDSILAVNDYALHAIEAANSNPPSIYSRAARALVPWSSHHPSADETVKSTFINAMSVLSETLNRLVVAAELPLLSLDRLEERLGTLHEIVAREDSSLQSSKADLLANIWTHLGGNRRKLHSHDRHLELLRNLGEYRKRALVHVVGAIQTLSAMSEEMEDLRERVAAPEIVGDSIPVEVHMRSIKIGLERLKRSREGRIDARQKEEDAISKALDAEDS